MTRAAGLAIACAVAVGAGLAAPSGQARVGMYTERTPSRAVYFDWINRNNWGSDEAKTLAGLRVFKWLHDRYGMRLDIFLMDAGLLDNAVNCATLPGRTSYGSFDSPWFREQFPRGLGRLAEDAASFGVKLGVWLGPDGFGDTPADARARVGLLTSLARDYRVAMFKFDACAGDLRPDKEPYFVEAMRAAYATHPDLIVLNHRINLSDDANRYATTFLWEGAEMYIDVLMTNHTTAPHHRAGALARGLPPGLQRLTEDHGVCLSSALDYWEDDVVLQAFNRNLIMAPEIYGSPWFLRDDELTRLARLFNLHRQYNEILVDGLALPERGYGPNAVSRGDSTTRLLTLRNLTWTPVLRTVRLDESIGLSRGPHVELRQYHPTERRIGIFPWGREVEVEVRPFRAALFLASTVPVEDVTVEGVDYVVDRDVAGQPLEITLLGLPGTDASIRVTDPRRAYASAEIDGQPVPALATGRSATVSFPGSPLTVDYHRKLGDLERVPVPGDAEALYEASAFAGDSNALEVRSILRSGPSGVDVVNAARDAFFEYPVFRDFGLWDRFAFDSDRATAFKAHRVTYALGRNRQEPIGALRVDLGRLVEASHFILRGVPDAYDPDQAEVSSDLRTWQPLRAGRQDRDVILVLPTPMPVRYLRVGVAPMAVSEIEGFDGDAAIPREGWRASNLFRRYSAGSAHSAWSGMVRPGKVTPNSYLAVAIPGEYGYEGAYAALRVGDRLVGAPDRAPSYPYNNWEHYSRSNGHYTYYFPMTTELASQEIDVVVLGFGDDMAEVRPDVWISAYPSPFVERTLVVR